MNYEYFDETIFSSSDVVNNISFNLKLNFFVISKSYLYVVISDSKFVCSWKSRFLFRYLRIRTERSSLAKFHWKTNIILMI